MTDTAPVPYSFAPRALVAAADSSFLSEAIAGAGFELTAHSALADLPDLRRRSVSDALVVRLDGEPDPDLLDDLFDAVEDGARVIVCFPAAAMEPVADRLGATTAVLIADAAPAELTAELALLHAQPRDRLHDSGANPDALRLQLLADQVGRIARSLAEMTQGEAPIGRRGGLRSPTDDFSATPRPIETDAPVTAKAVRAVIAERRLRDRFLDSDLFGEPAWDMLLDLYAARLEHQRVSVSSLCIAAAVPSTTALRWLRTLTESGLVVRRADPHDKRRVFIELGEPAARGLTGYFAELAAD